MESDIEYLSDYSRTQDRLALKEIGDLLYLKISNQSGNPAQSIIISKADIPSVIQYLQGVINDDK